MKRLINDGDIFDKYANLEERSLKDHPEEKLGSFNWTGHRHISGTYSGAAYSTSLGDGYMATDLRSSANPRGSILKEAKNYTDAQIANINSAPARHGYRIFRKGNFYYLAYTNKDYPLVVGQSTDVNDFKTNSDYQELRKNGEYPAGGYYKPLNRSATIMEISNNTFTLWGNVGTDQTFGVRDITTSMASDIAIIKLF